MTATSATDTDDHPATKEMEQRIADKKREEAERLAKKISHEATVYATILEEVRRRLGPLTEWGQHYEDHLGHVVAIPAASTPNPDLRVVKDPPLLSGSDLKDTATTIYIQISRGGGISWNR